MREINPGRIHGSIGSIFTSSRSFQGRISKFMMRVAGFFTVLPLQFFQALSRCFRVIRVKVRHCSIDTGFRVIRVMVMVRDCSVDTGFRVVRVMVMFRNCSVVTVMFKVSELKCLFRKSGSTDHFGESTGMNMDSSVVVKVRLGRA